MNKVYLFCSDSDMTMRSKPEPVKAFLTKEAAQKFADEVYKVEHKTPSYMNDWSIEELELINE